ncbi:MAG: AI-2E family transporter [Gammaproteobacteria bacterium]
MSDSYSGQTGRAGNVLLVLASLVVTIAGMKASAELLVPFLLATFIAIICSPPLFWLTRHRVPTGLAVAIIIGTLLFTGYLIGNFVGGSVTDFTQRLPEYQQRLSSELGTIAELANRFGIEVSSAALKERFDPAAVMGMVSQTLSGLGGVLANTFLILLTVIFILFEVSSLPHKLKVSLSEGSEVSEKLEGFTESVNTYLAIKSWVSLGTGLLVAIWLAILGVDYPLLWGLLALLFNFVPNIGSIIAAVPAVLLAYIQLGSGSALAAAAGFLVVNLLMGNVIEPRFMGRGLGLSTLVVFLSLIFWGWLLGPVGMLLSVPLTMIVKIALESSEQSRWITVLLGPDLPAPEPIAESEPIKLPLEQ